MEPIEVLIVEDNLKISRTHQAFVEKLEGFKVTGIANSIEDARLLFSTLEPDLILLDIYFPEGNGMDFLKEIRSLNDPVDIILITAAKEVEMLHNALHGGAFDYMIKPVFFARFQESLTSYQEHRERLLDLKNMTQEDANRFFRRPGVGHEETGETPKGIDPVTLKTITGIYEQVTNPCLSADEVGRKVGVSRTTARKYLEYLTSTGFLKVSLDYSTKGRPERKYLRENSKSETQTIPTN